MAAADQKIVSALERHPTTGFSVPSLKSRPPTGKSVYVMVCGDPVCQTMSTFVHSAARVLGWSFHTIQDGVTPQTDAAGYNLVVTRKPNVVIGTGAVPPNLISHQLSELKAEGTKTVLVDVPNGGSDYSAVLTSSTAAQQGTLAAQYVVANSVGKAIHAEIIAAQNSPIYNQAQSNLSKVITSACKSCSVSIYSTPDSAIGTTLPGAVASLLEAHPSVNWLFFDFSNMVDGVPSALASAGLASRAKIVTLDTTSTETAYIKDGTEAAAVAIPWPEMLWGAVDVAASQLEGGSGKAALNIKYPAMIWVKSDIPPLSVAMEPVYLNYQAVFKKVWHVG